MRNIYKNFIGIILAFVTVTSIAQPGWTVYNTVNSTLTSSIFRTIAIDQSANIWIGGSYSGLYKYNGTTFTKYSTSTTNLLHDDIHRIIIDNTNKVWAANFKGISVFNGTTFTNYDTVNASFNGMTVYSMAKDNLGKIWLASRNGSFGYQGITTYNGSTWTNITGYPTQLLNAEFPDFAFATNNDAWIACQNGVVKHNGTAFTYYYPSVSSTSSERIAIDASGNVWVGSFDELVKYDGTSWTKFDNMTSLGMLSSNTLYYEIFPDGNILWIGCSGGLIKFDRINGIVLANYKSGNSPLTDNCVSQITKDANGNLWMATNVGVVKMNPALVDIEENKNLTIKSIYPNPSEGIFNISIAFNKSLNYKVFSLNGILINEGETTSHNFQINLSKFPQGIYYALLSNDNINSKVIKLIKF